MDISHTGWNYEQEIVDCDFGNDFINSPRLDPLDAELRTPPLRETETWDSLGRPTKKIKSIGSWNRSTSLESTSSTSHLISFSNSGFSKPNNNPTTSCGLVSSVEPQEDDYARKAGHGAKRDSSGTVTRHSLFTHNHLMAERKRREKLSQQFIALLAIVPGLKKLDKASVLGDAIKYLKQLEEQVKLLEEQTRKNSENSFVFENKSEVPIIDISSSSEQQTAGCNNEGLPEIKVRVAEKNVLISIYCENQKGMLVKILSKLENLHLSVVNSDVLPFANSLWICL